jgi:hypothetical protein
MKLTRPMLAALLLSATSGSAVAQNEPGPSDAQRVENLCRLNPGAAVCLARLKGKAATGGLDLAASVAKGEGYRTSPETRSEILGCWATLTAISERISASGQETWPKSYTPAALAARAKQWDKAAAGAYKELKDSFGPDRAKALEGARAEVSGVNIVYAAETAGNCKNPAS